MHNSFPRLHIVVTGGSRGIGRALALEFLKKECLVTISGRNKESILSTVEALKTESGFSHCLGIPCDVRNLEELQLLWQKASKLQPVDIWINNAGINHRTRSLLELDPSEINSVIDTNIRGTILGSRVALAGMKQQGFGSLYNMEGLGSDGRIVAGTSIYGTSKSAVRYFTRSLIKEYQNTPLTVGSISPGMVVTDMILKPLEGEPEKHRSAIKIFHILADTPERVTPWIVQKLLENKRHGRHIAWLSSSKILLRFLLNMFKKRKVEGLPPF